MNLFLPLRVLLLSMSHQANTHGKPSINENAFQPRASSLYPIVDDDNEFDLAEPDESPEQLHRSRAFSYQESTNSFQDSASHTPFRSPSIDSQPRHISSRENSPEATMNSYDGYASHTPFGSPPMNSQQLNSHYADESHIDDTHNEGEELSPDFEIQDPYYMFRSQVLEAKWLGATIRK